MPKISINYSEFIKHYEKCLSDSKISKIFNVSYSTITRYRNSLGLKPKKHVAYNKINIEIEVFMKYYNDFKSDNKISKLLRVNSEVISNLRKSLNLPEVSESHRYREKIRYFVDKGFSDSFIATQIPISKSHIQYVRKKMGLKTNFIERRYLNKTDRRKGRIIGNIKHSAKKRELEFNLDYTDLELPKYCPILGIKLQYGYNPNNLYNASVDRIDNSKGYVKGNIIVVSRLANVMKNSANLNELQLFIDNYQKIINYYKNHSALGSITDIFPNTEMYEET